MGEKNSIIIPTVSSGNKLNKHKVKMLDRLFLTLFGRKYSEVEYILKESSELDFLNEYRSALSLWAEHTEDTKQKVIVTLDGRDTAGKGSNIKRVTEYLDISRHNVKAFPGVPTPAEKFQDNWFQRYEKFFPEDSNITFFDRSWYNRAFVEPAMGFCTEEEYNWFMGNVNQFERDRIIGEGYDFIKVYLSVGKDIQKMRLERRESIRKRWKSSPVDAKAQEKWNYYTLAKYNVLTQTDTPESPWIILDSTEKWLSSIEIIKMILSTREEVKKLIVKDLGIDLSLNCDIRRNAKDELLRMKKVGDTKKMKTEFKFAS